MYEFQLFNNWLVTAGLPSCPPITYKGYDEAGWYGGRIISGELVSGADRNPIGELIFQLFSQNKNDKKKEYLLYTEQKWSDIYYADLTECTSGPCKEFNAKTINTARNNWNDAYECLQKEGNRLLQTDDDSGKSMKDILETCPTYHNDGAGKKGGSDERRIQRLLEWVELDWEFVLGTDKASAKGNVPLWTYYLMQDKDWFVTAEGTYYPNGSIDVPPNLAKVADRTVKEFIPNYNNVAVRGQKISEIVWNSNKNCVDVSFVDTAAQATTAKKTLVTFSVGALVEQSQQTSPVLPLPPARINLLKKVFYLHENQVPANYYENTMGLYKLLFVQFSDALWQELKNANRIPRTEFIFMVPPEGDISKIGECTYWQVLDTDWQNEFFSGSRAFACTLVTEKYKILANNDGVLEENVVMDLIRNTLFKVLGYDKLDDLPQSENCKASDPYPTGPTQKRMELFSPDPDFRKYSSKGSVDCLYEIRDGYNGAGDSSIPSNKWMGAWSTFENTAWKNGDYKETRQPLEDGGNKYMYFAGEALCPVYAGFQHGAWNSGRLVARDMIRDLRTQNQLPKEDFENFVKYSDTQISTGRGVECEIPTDGTTPVRKAKTIP